MGSAGPQREFVGTVWLGREPGERFAVDAATYDDAFAAAEARFGTDRDFTLWNEQESSEPAGAGARRRLADQPLWTMRDQRCIERLFEERFSFLEQRGGRVERETHATDRSIAYLFDDLCFEITMEQRDSFAGLLLERPIDGARPPGFMVHEGRQVRRNLPDAMDLTGLDGGAVVQRYRADRVVAGPQAIIARLELTAAVLEPCVDHLLAHADQIFPADG